MPSPNIIKTFTENAYYHVYNRGVEKRRIYEDAQDYKMFLYYLKIYLSSIDELHSEYPLLRSNIVNNNLFGKVDLLAYCLMPNHYHLLLRQTTKDGIAKLMKQVGTAYSMYYNKRHNRIGHLFQNTYKGVMVTTDEQLLHLSRYIHLNPIARGASLDDFQWSSYNHYLKKGGPSWIKINHVLDFFNEQSPALSYENFVEKYVEELPHLNKLTIDETEE